MSVDDAESRSGSIFASFARQGQKPVKYSHRAHTNPEVRARLVKWVTENSRPANIINDRELKDLLTAGRPHISLPSSKTISRDIKASFEKCRERVEKLLREHPGRLHFATDAWTSPNHRAFLAWTVHIEYQGEMLAFLLDIIEIPESHTGVTMARAFQEMLEQFHITDRIFAVNADNASPNDTQTTSLGDLSNSFEPVNRVRCFNHTLQLSAKTLLAPFNVGISKTKDNITCSDSDISDTDHFDGMPGLDEINTDDNSEVNDIEGEGGDNGGEEEDDAEDPDDGVDEFGSLTEEQREIFLADTAAVRHTVTKIRSLSFAIINSTTIVLPAWRTFCETHKLKANLLPRDVVTRWNSTYDMMSFALKYRLPIDSITADKSLKLRKFELDSDDWKVIEDLVDILQQYKEATLYFSKDSASIAAVIPAMDKLTESLSSHTTTTYHPAINAALRLAKKKMDRYYGLTDSSQIYRIAMVLHPGLKLEYFRRHQWEEEWIEQAENMTREEFITSYENLRDTPSDAGPSVSPETRVVAHVGSFSDFGNISVGAGPSHHVSEIDDYLRTPIENVQEPLKWWVDKQRVYPKLARMALDYLSVPATSTAVERVFSQGRHLLHFTRNRLSPSSIRSHLCLGSWGRHDLLLMEDLLTAVNPKSNKRKVESIIVVEEEEDV